MAKIFLIYKFDVDKKAEEELEKLVLLLDFPFIYLLWDAKPRLYMHYA